MEADDAAVALREARAYLREIRKANGEYRLQEHFTGTRGTAGVSTCV